MAITTSCCLNLPLPTSASGLPSSTTKTSTTQVSWLKNDKWRRQCVLGIAWMIIGAEMDNLASQENLAMAKDMQYSVVESKSQRWSDKRMCPPWRLNSLETVVPENLPRPSARRRWEATGYSENAPPPASAVKVMVHSGNSCFTM
ncbi:hypothetical protein JCGZ_07216 [Jatropha curcas]|uniref:Uncharacterized protein n=1 Tax=Jatropha curcas TaxID=180498 RepID=A0A067KMZ2_JATCU|nr:uncharacterized protein LOC105637692 [Jatropha curcas]KDP33645.1 hypothetical protein JCGZ_07216 [Jatropha curcas]